jgi:NAD+ kinase
LAARIAVVSRLDNDEALKVAKELYNNLRKRGHSVIAEQQFARRVKIDGGRDFAEFDADLIVTVGGDGTVLKTCMQIPRPDTPILAVNMGRRGYLTEVTPREAVKAIDTFLKGKCRLEQRSKLSVHFEGQRLADGLNEAVITSSTPSKMLSFRVEIDGSQFLEFRADGMIVSTPTGSTAYSLSAGGPIVDNSLQLFVLSFICPLEGVSPAVVGMDKTITIHLLDPKLRATLVVDGRHQRELMPRTSIAIKRSDKKAVFARVKEVTPIRTLMRLPEPERGNA